ncbi:MAG: hypothetical protein FVQ84_05450 [Planctomycetes bacterium]|nr:hypothetical protein [Planctomycetota bacterium]
MKSKTNICFASPSVSLIVLCLTIGIAFAQTGHSNQTVTIKSKLSRSAVIEQPASAIMIKGRILDPNNEPAYGARIVALPVTSWGYEIRHRNKEGYFELPWSPTWIEDGQPIYLMAIIQELKSEAALVEVTDPTKPVTVRLGPAFTLTGKVVDPSGQQIEECWTTISLATEFKCQAPIFWALRGNLWERALSPLPYGTKYRLTIKAEGYQTKQIIVDATDISQKVIYLGKITLQPQDSSKSTVAGHRPNPDLAKEFHEVYSLDEGEIIKLIKPPFVLGRQEYFQIPTSSYGSVFLSLESQGAFQVNLIWDGEQLKMPQSGYTNTHRPPTLEYILNLTLRMPYCDFNLPKELDIKIPYGDWIVRTDSPMAEQLRALEEIIYAETNRSIRFEKRKVEREVIVAKGRYKFKSHPNGISPNYIHVTWDGTLSNLERTVNLLGEFFWHLERNIKMKVVDETEPMEKTTIQFKTSKNLAWLGNSNDVKNKSLRGFLFNLSLTTSLQFKVENRLTDIWFVTETK